MNRYSAIPGLLALTMICVVSPFRAGGAMVDWTEQGDAGDSIAGAQDTIGLLSDDLVTIHGSANATDRDIYRIYISSPGSFDINVTSVSVSGGDPIMALFDASGLGLVYNDDQAEGIVRARLTGGGGFISTAGVYYLAIMGSDTEFLGQDGNPIWFESPTWELEKGPDTGAGSSDDDILNGYAFAGPGTDLGNYVITFSGVAPVPEPSYYGIAFAVLGLCAAFVHSQKSLRRRGDMAAGRQICSC